MPSELLDQGDKDLVVRSIKVTNGIYSAEISRIVTQIIQTAGNIQTIYASLDGLFMGLKKSGIDLSLGEIIDGAIARAKLEAGFLSEFNAVSSELFPQGTSGQSRIDVIVPRFDLDAAMVQHLNDLISNAEAGLQVTRDSLSISFAQADADRTRISSLEINLDGLTSTVAQLIPLQSGQIANLTQIVQNASAIELLATQGKYDPGTGLVDSLTEAKVKVLNDRFDVLVAGQGPDFSQLASFVVTPGSITSTVQNIMNTDAAVQAAVSSAVQTSTTYQIAMQAFRDEVIDGLDSRTKDVEAGLLMTAARIELGVRDAQDGLEALIVIERDRITSEVSRASGAESDLATQIIQTADAINLAVWGSTTPGTQSLSSQLAMHAGSIGALVAGGGASAFLGLSVTLPAFVSASQYQQFVASAGQAAVDSVYVLTSLGYYVVSDTALPADLQSLKWILKNAGLLGSQIVADANEILLGGKVKAANIDVDDLMASTLIMKTGGVIKSSNYDALAKTGWALTETEAQLQAASIVGKLDASQINGQSLNIVNGTFSGYIDTSVFKSKPGNTTVLPTVSFNNVATQAKDMYNYFVSQNLGEYGAYRWNSTSLSYQPAYFNFHQTMDVYTVGSAWNFVFDYKYYVNFLRSDYSIICSIYCYERSDIGVYDHSQTESFNGNIAIGGDEFYFDINGLPSAPTGLAPGRVYYDSTGFLKIAMP